MNRTILGIISMIGSASSLAMLFALAYVHDTSGNQPAMLALIASMMVSLFVAAMSIVLGYANQR